MSLASNIRPQKSKKNIARTGVAKVRTSMSHLLRSQTPSGKTAPNWAQEAIFNHAGVIVWEGMTEPLSATKLFPSDSPLLNRLQIVRKAGVVQWMESIHPLDKDRVSRAFRSLAAAPFSIDYRMVSSDDEFVWVRHSIVSVEQNIAPLFAQGFVRDIQTEKELELESLRISEREQNRIGQDLHDDLCQVLAGVSCLMRVAEGRLSAKVPEEVPAIAELNQQIIEAMHRTRALTHGLFPGKVQISDVRGALLELIQQVQARFQVDVKPQFSGRFPRHTTDQIIQIYRLTQEAISNAIKHGHATCIEVRLEAQDANMSLSITDNGSGLSQNEPGGNGVGHHIMQYRTRTLGGELSIRNAPDRGVVVRLTYPFLH
ncbi:MAG: ATP-binding protein [Nibricoccus sp.]